MSGQQLGLSPLEHAVMGEDAHIERGTKNQSHFDWVSH